jgi:hypothetical protein
MNDNSHEQFGAANARRDGRIRGGQSARDLVGSGTRICLQAGRAGAEGTAILSTEQRATRNREALSGEDHRFEPSPTDATDPAVRHLCQRAWVVFGNEKFQRLAGISASHIYNLRRSAAYGKIRVRVAHTQGSKVSIGERRRPEPKGRPGYLRVDTVHQGEHDGQAGGITSMPSIRLRSGKWWAARRPSANGI